MKLRRTYAIILISFFSSAFLAEGQVSVRFSVDMSLLAEQGKFSYESDRVLLRGFFNNWGDQAALAREGSTSVYSVTLTLDRNIYTEYKYFITTPGAENSGWESEAGFGTSGNRPLNIGTNNLVLPVVFYNNADMVLALTTDHFNLICSSQDLPIIPGYSSTVEASYLTVSAGLKVAAGSRITIRMYKDLDQLHLATGNPESSANSIGSAFGKDLIVLVSPGQPGTGRYDELVGLIDHELTHCLVAWKTTAALPVWLNEGIATWFGHNNPTKDYVVYLIEQLGHMPTLTEIENSDFAATGGYSFSYTIAEFVVMTHGMDKMAAFIGSVDYTGLGYASRADFEAAWHQYLRDHYIGHTGMGQSRDQGFRLYPNYPNPVTSVATIRFDLDTPGPVTLIITDLNGRPVYFSSQEFLPGGSRILQIDLHDQPAGVYLYRLISGNRSECRRLIRN